MHLGGMDASLTRLIEVVRASVATGVQISTAFNAEQSQLKLDEVLSAKRLASEAGTRRSLETIGALDVLVKRHKAVFQAYVPTVANNFAMALAELPVDQQQRLGAEVLQGLQAGLQNQGAF